MTKKKESVVVEGIFDKEIAELYESYPRKAGKTAGMLKLKKIIKTREDLDRFKLAFDNYIAELIRNNTQEKYIKHWSTFVNQHEDYLEVAVIPDKNNPMDQLQRILKGEL